uniref:Uncharacterized protein n=1 Tax=Rangifer tarandus platyrhynchus TaxID=3082113 RepID=A0ACB0DTV7_RANTA|nr:unnamed protein product [Rangifer tarandus platyrhynchus]
MGNQLCCGGSWSCTSTLQRKKKIARDRGGKGASKPRIFLNAVRSSQDTMGHLYEQVLLQPASQQRSRQSLRSEDSGLYYADIQLYSFPQPRSVQEVKHLQLKNATEYATLRFPQVTTRYDSKNGTLV